MQYGNPALSIILPVFNCERYLKPAIDSILSQTFTDFELLIADDGSADDSKAIIEGYARKDRRIHPFHNQENKGKVFTCNHLFEFCRGKYITVHDADDVSHETRFEKQIHLMEQKQELVMCGTSFRIIKENGSLFRDAIMPDNYQDILSRICHSSQFHGPTMVMRKEALDNCLYRSFFDGYNEDCDLAFRLVEKGYCTNLSDILYTYRILPGSLSKNITARKKSLYKMALAFHRQRMMNGVDDLMRGKASEAEEKLGGFMQPYMEDPSLIYRENAAFLMHYELNKPAIRNAWRATVLKPLDFKNIRTLQYCIRRTIIGL